MAIRKVKLQGYTERVEKAIRGTGMSKMEVALRCGLDDHYFYMSKYNDTQMTAGVLARFCVVTGVSADYILGLKGE
jgi:hypothetical protein